MKKTFNRLLSLVLTLILLVGLVPAGSISFAAVGDTEVVDFKIVSATTNLHAQGKFDGYGLSGNTNWMYLGRQSWSGLHRLEASAGLRVRVDVTPGRAATAVKFKFLNGSLTAGTFDVSMKTSTIYDHGSSTKDFAVYLAKYDEAKTAPDDYMTEENLLFKPNSFHPLIAAGAATEVTHNLGSYEVDDIDAEYVLVFDIQGKEYHINNITFKQKTALANEYENEITAEKTEISAPKNYGVYALELKAKSGETLEGVSAYIAPKDTADLVSDANKIIADASGEAFVGDKLFFALKSEPKLSLHIDGYEKVESATLRKVESVATVVTLSPETLTATKAGRANVKVNGCEVLPWAVSMKSSNDALVTAASDGTLTVKKPGEVTLTATVGDTGRAEYTASVTTTIAEAPKLLELSELEAVPGAPAGYTAVILPEFDAYGIYSAEIAKASAGGDDAFSVYFAEYTDGDASAYMTEENLVGADLTYTSGKVTVTEAFEVKNYVPHILIIGESAETIDFKKALELPPYLVDFTKPKPSSRTWVDSFTTLTAKNPNWVFFDFSDDFELVRQGGDLEALNIRTNLITTTGFKIANSYDNDAKLLQDNTWTALRIVSEEVGIFDLTFTMGTCYGTKKVDLYLAPYEEGKNDGEDYMTEENRKVSNADLASAKIEGIKFDGKTDYIMVVDVADTVYNDVIISSINCAKVDDLEREYKTDITAAETEVSAPENYGVYELVLEAASGEDLSDVNAYVAPKGTLGYKTDANKVVEDGESVKLFVPLSGTDKLLIAIDNYEKVKSATLKKIDGAKAELALSPATLVEGEAAEAVVTVNGKRIAPWAVTIKSSDEALLTAKNDGTLTVKKPGAVTIEATIGNISNANYTASIETEIAEAPDVIKLSELDEVSGAPSGYTAVIVPGFDAYGVHSAKITKKLLGGNAAFSVYFAEYKGGNADAYMTEDNLVAEGVTYTDGEAFVDEAFEIKNNVPHILIIGESAKEVELSRLYTNPYTFDFTKVYKDVQKRTWVDQYTELNDVRNPNWRFLDYSDDFAEIRGVAEFVNLDIRTNTMGGNGIRFSNTWSDKPAEFMREEAWLALRLTAEERGIYDLTITIDPTQSYGVKKANVYFAPYEEGKNDGEYYMTAQNLKLQNSGLTNAVIEDVVADGNGEFVIVFDITNPSYNEFIITSVNLTKKGDLDKEFTHAVTGADMEVPTPANFGVYELILNAKSGENLKGAQAYLAPKGSANLVSDANKVFADGEVAMLFAALTGTEKLALHIDNADKVESVTFRKVDVPFVQLALDPEKLTQGKTGRAVVTVNGKDVTPWSVSVTSSDTSLAEVSGTDITVKKVGIVTFTAQVADKMYNQDYSASVMTKIAAPDVDTLPETITAVLPSTYIEVGRPFEIKVADADGNEITAGNIKITFDGIDSDYLKFDGIYFTAKKLGKTTLKVKAEMNGTSAETELEIIIISSNLLTRVAVNGQGAAIAHGDFETMPASKPSESHGDVKDIKKLKTMWIFDHNYLYNKSRSYFYNYDLVEGDSPKYAGEKTNILKIDFDWTRTAAETFHLARVKTYPSVYDWTGNTGHSGYVKGSKGKIYQLSGWFKVDESVTEVPSNIYASLGYFNDGDDPTTKAKEVCYQYADWSSGRVYINNLSPTSASDRADAVPGEWIYFETKPIYQNWPELIATGVGGEEDVVWLNPVLDIATSKTANPTYYIANLAINEVLFDRVDFKHTGDFSKAVVYDKFTTSITPYSNKGQKITRAAVKTPFDVKYSTTNKYVAKVDDSGVITAVSNGSCEIWADMTIGDTTVRGIIPVTFEGLDVIFETVEGEISKDTIKSGETAEVTQRFYYTTGDEYFDTPESENDNVRIYYESANPLIASVDQNGVVTAKASGTTTIGIYAEQGIILAKDEVTITVIDESEIDFVTVSGPNIVEENFQIKLRAKATNESGNLALADEVTFDYADEESKEFIEVSEDGTILGLTPGIARVVATFKSSTGSVKESEPYEITVSPRHPVDKIIDFQLGKLAAGATTANFKFHSYEVNETYTDPALVEDSHATKPDNFRWLPTGLFCNTAKNSETGGNVLAADVAFNVKIDHSGWYLPRFTGDLYYNSTTRGEIYFNREYLGHYDFYSRVSYKLGYPKKLNPIYLEKGINLLTFRSAAVNPEGNDQMYLQSLELEYIDEVPTIADVVVTSEKTSLAIGESARVDTIATLENGIVYEFGFKHGYKGNAEFPENTPSDKAFTEYETSDESVAKVENGRLIAVGKGTCELTATAHLYDEVVSSEKITITVTEDILDRIEVSPTKSSIVSGKRLSFQTKAFLTNGNEIASRDMTVVYSADDSDKLKKTDYFNSFDANQTGDTFVTVTVTFNGKTLTQDMPVTVIGEGFATVDATVFSQVLRPGDAGYDIKVKCYDVAGEEMDAQSAIVTYESSDENVVSVSETGHVTPKNVGTAEVTVLVELDGIAREKVLTFSVRNGKTERTYYTAEKIENARENQSKYDWAKSSVKSTVAMADKYVRYIDHLYEMMPSEGIPRTGDIGIVKDRYDYATCRYCGTQLQKTSYGSNGWIMDALRDPWKVRCPKCSRRFPSNDFGSFFELGKDEHGAFSLQLAHNRHREKFIKQIEEEYGAEYVTMKAPLDEYTEDWYKYYGYGVKGGYLTNDLYPEIKDIDPWTGEKTEGHGKWWCVDNGFGWRSGRMVGYDSEEKEPERSAFIGMYLMMGLWNPHTSNAKHYPAFYHAMYDCSLAYVYTGKKEYARVAAIILDRVADFYPDYDLNEYYKIYRNSNEHGKQGGGKILGNIHESGKLAKIFPTVYDAVFDIYEDEEVLEFLTEKAIKYNLEDKLVNGKVTPETLRSNVEKNIFMEFLPAVKCGDITGNFGFFQNLLVKTAIVIDDPVTTPELLDFTMQAGVESGGYGHKSTRTWTACTGGNVLAQIVNLVDRDGYGDEVSLPYNGIWTSSLLTIAEDLTDYASIRPENVRPEYSLLENPKYIKMLKMYYPTVVSGAVHANIGDSGDVARRDPTFVASGSASFERAGLKATGDPLFAQMLYQSNGRKVEGIHDSIFDKDPEAIQEQLEALIEEYGEIDYSKSQLLSGYGYSSLISGRNRNDVTEATKSNTLRTFWMFYGGGQGHRHMDRLNIGIDFYGYDFAPEFGYPENVGVAAGQINKKWYSGTLSHNTVMVDEKNQDGVSRIAEADILHFDDSGEIKLMDVDAPLSYRETTEIYRRSLLTIDIDDEATYAVDFFRVKGGSEHVYSFHSQSRQITFGDELTFVEQPFGTYAGANIAYGDEINYTRSSGYNFLERVRRATNPGTGEFTADFKVEYLRREAKNPPNDLGMKFTMLNKFNVTEVASAIGHPPSHGGNPQEFEYLLVKREGEDLDSLFASVIEPYKGASKILSSENVDIVRADGRPITENDPAQAIKVTLVNGRTDYIVYAADKTSEYIISEDGEELFRFIGFMGVYTIREDGEVARIYLHDGVKLDDGNEYSIAEGEADGEVTGRVKDFTKGMAFETFIDLTSDSDIEASALVGQIINVQTDNTQNGVYRIVDAENTNDGYRISIGDVALPRALRDADNLDAGYIYNISEGAKFAIPLTEYASTAPEIRTADGETEYTASVGSITSIQIEAESMLDVPLTFDTSRLPQGASFDEETRTIHWKPSKSQTGKNLVTITVSDGAFATRLEFIVKVFGSTTTGGGGGGGGGGGLDLPSKPDEPGTPEEPETPEVPEEPETPDTPVAPEDKGFIDLGSHAWAEDAINSLAAEGIIKGTSDITYSPAANITRADFAILLVRAFKLESANSENFADVQPSDYFARELAIARNAGIVGGIGDNKYAPRNTITRQDMMVIVYRALMKLGIELKDGEVNYSDFDKLPDYAKEAVRALISNGLVNGKNGLIDGAANTTRAEVAVLIRRILDFVASK